METFNSHDNRKHKNYYFVMLVFVFFAAASEFVTFDESAPQWFKITRAITALVATLCFTLRIGEEKKFSVLKLSFGVQLIFASQMILYLFLEKNADNIIAPMRDFFGLCFLIWCLGCALYLNSITLTAAKSGRAVGFPMFCSGISLLSLGAYYALPALIKLPMPQFPWLSIPLLALAAGFYRIATLEKLEHI